MTLSSNALEVGDISDIDLEAVRGVIAASQESDASSSIAEPTQRLLLSLEESVKLALENNLGLQVSILALESAGQSIRGAKAKFHPSLIITGGVSVAARLRTEL